MSKGQRLRATRGGYEPPPRQRSPKVRQRWWLGLAAVMLLVAGYGLGTASTAVIGLTQMMEMRDGGTGAQDPRQAMMEQMLGGGGSGQDQQAMQQQMMQQMLGGGGAANRGTLGITVVDDPESGARVADVVEGGPAAAAGLRTDDVIVAADDYEVTSAAGLTELVSSAEPSSTLSLLVRGSDGTTTEREVSVGADL